MARSGPAKLTRPHAAGAVPRARLFARLDSAARAIWIAGPPGSGKTTLLGSYLAARAPHQAWYSIDEGDADAASVFHHLGELARRLAPDSPRALPALTPEYRLGVAAFARRFFAAFFAGLPEPFVLVLDDLHALPAQAELWTLLPALLAAAPERTRVVLLSRDDPPASLARARANGELELVSAEELRLDSSEAAAVVQARAAGAASEEQIAKLEARTQGWVAGLVLLVDAGARAGDEALGDPTTPAALFDYFASEVLERMSAAERETLLAAALFRRVSESLARNLGTPAPADEVLGGLAARHYFTETLSGPELIWQLHPLFHDFLRARGSRELPEAARIRYLRTGARVLSELEETELAAAAMIESADWEPLARLAAGHARDLLAAGRAATLLAWLRALPDAAAERDPELHYWRGRALLPVDLEGSRRALARATQAFELQGDSSRMALALAELLDTFYYAWDSYQPIDPWLDRLESLLASGVELPGAVERRLVPSAFRAFLHRQPDHPQLSLLLERVHAQLDDDDADASLAAAICLAEYYVWVGPVSRTAAAVASARRAAARARGGALASRPIDVAEAIVLWQTLRGRESMRLVDRALEDAREDGMHLLDARLLSQGAYAAQCARDPEASARYLGALERAAPRSSRLERTHLQFHRAWAAASRGELASADVDLEAAHDANLSAGFPISTLVTGLFSATLAIERGDLGRAAERLAAAETVARSMRSELLITHAALVRADLCYARGEGAAGATALGEGLRGLASTGMRFNAGFTPAMLERLCERAVRGGIEADFARELIRRHDVAPERPPLDLSGWPWALELRSFGGLDIRCGGAALRVTQKAQQRPLDLLKALIALGGRDVAASTLESLVWPDAEGDHAHRSLATNLHRLRRLLGSERLVVLHAGRVSLDSRRVWLDVWALDALLKEPESEPALEAALALHVGPFLSGDDAPWILAFRERLRTRLVRAIRDHGARLEAAGDLERASAWYERGVDLDERAEGLWQRLMVCHRELGRPAEALAAYERCHAALLCLGAEPSTTTRALANALRG